MSRIADWFIHGEVDWDWWQEQSQKWSPVVAGGLFGGAWWVWADALVYEQTTQGLSPPFKYQLPGIVATVALLLINLVSRYDLTEIAQSGDEGADMRARLWLLFSFLLAFGAVGGSVAVLVSSQGQQLGSIGVGSVVQCACILASALLFWAFRTEGDGGGYGFM